MISGTRSSTSEKYCVPEESLATVLSSAASQSIEGTDSVTILVKASTFSTGVPSTSLFKFAERQTGLTAPFQMTEMRNIVNPKIIPAVTSRRLRFLSDFSCDHGRHNPATTIKTKTSTPLNCDIIEANFGTIVETHAAAPYRYPLRRF